jgi:hypothetical protein
MRRKTTRSRAVAPAVLAAPPEPPVVLPDVPWRRRFKDSRASFGSVRQTVESIAAGEYRIPPFQRPFVWTDDAVIALLDSLLAGHYVGTLLLWERYRQPAAGVMFGGVAVRSPEGHAYVVIDGQQRLGSLAAAFLSGRFYVDLLTGKFTTAPKPTDLPLTILIDPTFEIIDWGKRPEIVAAFGEKVGSRLGAKMMDALLWGPTVQTFILDHEAPASHVVETFRRLNTHGTPMSADDLAAALARYEEQASHAV